jgi:predicted MFS family arabinose efflux permease
VQGLLRLSAGNGLALAGIRLQSVVLGWLVLEMTGSKVLLGLVVGLPAFGVVGASVLGGVLSDSRHARAALMWARLAMAAASIFAGLLVTAGQVEIGLLMLVTLVTAFATAVDMPVGRTLIFDTVGRERVLSGTAMTSMATNLCAVAGPLAIGVLMGRFGVDIALFAIAGSYVAAALLVPAVQGRREATKQSAPLKDLLAGFDYLRRTPCVAWLVSLCFLVPIAGVFFAMVPVYAHEVLEAGPAGLGVLMAAYGGGTVIGSGYLVVNGQMRRRGLRVTQIGVLFGAGVLAYAFSASVLLSGVIAFGIGITTMLWMNTLTALVQTAAAPEMKGRAMSIGTMGMQLMSLGWLIAGVLSSLAGSVATMAGAGVAFAVLSLVVYAQSADVRAID